MAEDPSPDIHEVVRGLVEEVRRAGPTKGASGSYIGSFLRTYFPGFQFQKYGVWSLSEFIFKIIPA